MSKITSFTNHRRHFLRLGVTLASGISIPMVFNGCSRDDPIMRDGIPQQTFIQPPLLEASHGLLDVTLTVSYLHTKLSGQSPHDQFSVRLRAYGYNDKGPSVFGPTLVINGGDQLRIKLINQLPFNPPVAPNDPLLFMKPNTTNLHMHGLHVYPGVYQESKPVEYGDYVVDSNTGGVVPQGDSRQYVYNIPTNHPAGPFYYHPQFHGSSATQVASLMQGAILIRGPVDELPEMAQAKELIFLFQAPYYASNKMNNNDGVKAGHLEKFSQLASHPSVFSLKKTNPSLGYFNVQPTLINGIRQPTIVMESGEVQRWRFINTQVLNYLNLNLDGHVMRQYTMDGWGSASYQEYPDARQQGGRGISLSPGNRSSVVIKAGLPGIYFLRSLPVKIAQGELKVVLPADILAQVIVVEPTRRIKEDDQTVTQNIPAAPLPVSDYLKPITDQEFATNGGKKRNIILSMVRDELQESQAIDSSPSDKPVREYQPQASNTMIQNVILDAVEEWTVFNFNSISRPFHFHVNPMYVTKVNGVSIQPYWCDTATLPSGGTTSMPTSITFRMRFNDFIGPFVLHSQMLMESDLGLIQRVTVLPK